MDTLKITFALVSILMIVSAIPMILRKVPPNRIYGFRTRKTLSDPEIWYEANAYAGKLMFIWGIFIAVGSFEVERIPGIGVDGYANGMTILLLVVGIVVMILSLRHINRLG